MNLEKDLIMLLRRIIANKDRPETLKECINRAEAFLWHYKLGTGEILRSEDPELTAARELVEAARNYNLGHHPTRICCDYTAGCTCGFSRLEMALERYDKTRSGEDEYV